MKVVLFGGTGMVGQGVLRECLLDDGVTEVLSIVRTQSGQPNPKLRELVHRDFYDFTSVAGQLSGFDACFFCLGATSAGKTEAEYTRITYDITIAAASVLVKMSPRMTFIFVSGASSDSTEQGRVMWARIKGKAENAVLAMPFKASYVFRPAVIQAKHGITSRTTLYRVLYPVIGIIMPVIRLIAPRYITTTDTIGRAMLIVARKGAPKRLLENGDINDVAAAG